MFCDERGRTMKLKLSKPLWLVSGVVAVGVPHTWFHLHAVSYLWSHSGSQNHRTPGCGYG
jgi:hypothetical protein